MPKPLRLILLALGLLTLLAGTALIVWSFNIEGAYYRSNPLLFTLTGRRGLEPAALFYAGTAQADLEEAAIRLMTIGIWTAFAGAALGLLSLTGSRRKAEKKPADVQPVDAPSRDAQTDS